MGLVRLILAISVIISHTTPILGMTLIGGHFAVEVFFIISGFYMALILEEKYNKEGGRKLFFRNRFLKIYPLYWVVFVLSLIFEVVNRQFSSNEPYLLFFTDQVNLTVFSFIILALSNLVIFGLDIFMSLSLNAAGTFFMNPNPLTFPPPVYTLMVVPQAWSLGAEVMFYLAAPFLVKLKSKWLLIIIGLSLILRFILYKNGFEINVFSHGAFPTALFEFVSGIIAYRIYKTLRAKEISKKVMMAILGAYVGYLFVFQYIPIHELRVAILFLASIFLLPFLFKLSKDNKFDRYVGELSYPIYLLHFLVFLCFAHFVPMHHQYWGIAVTAASIIGAMILVEAVVKPIDRWRRVC